MVAACILTLARDNSSFGRSGARQTGSIWVMVDRPIAGVAAFLNSRTRTVARANRARIVQGRVNTETGGTGTDGRSSEVRRH